MSPDEAGALTERLRAGALDPVEEARAIRRLAELGLSQERIATDLGRGRSTIANSLRLLKLPEEALAALQAGEITPGHARAILALPARARGRALKLITAQGLTVRQAEALRETLGTERKAGRPEEARPHSQLELELSRHAGTKVRLVGGRRGRLELHYGSPEELERLIGLLGYQP